jgi:hypothetical protein
MKMTEKRFVAQGNFLLIVRQLAVSLTTARRGFYRKECLHFSKADIQP